MPAKKNLYALLIVLLALLLILIVYLVYEKRIELIKNKAANAMILLLEKPFNTFKS